MEKDPRHFKGNEEDPGLAQVGYILLLIGGVEISSHLSTI